MNIHSSGAFGRKDDASWGTMVDDGAGTLATQKTVSRPTLRPRSAFWDGVAQFSTTVKDFGIDANSMENIWLLKVRSSRGDRAESKYGIQI